MVRLRWAEDGEPRPRLARCDAEISKLFPQLILSFSVDVADLGWLPELSNFIVVVDPDLEVPKPGGGYSFLRMFHVWVYDEYVWRTGEFDWTDEALRAVDDSALDDLDDAISDQDEPGAFDAFTRLRGGSIEFVAWAAPDRDASKKPQTGIEKAKIEEHDRPTDRGPRPRRG